MQILDRKNFKGEEFYFSNTAIRNGIDNNPPVNLIPNGVILADKTQQIRDLIGKPIKINSGYRSLKLNRLIGSKDTSQHRLFQAIDFVAPDFGIPENIVLFLKENKIEVDQCLIEFNAWVHLSIKEKGNRNQFAYLDFNGFRII